MCCSRRKTNALALVIVGLLAGVGQAETSSILLYWTDPGFDRIERVYVDDDEVFNRLALILELDGPAAIALDPTAGKMYWTDTTFGTIERANLNRWREEGSRTVGEKAREEVERLVEAARPVRLPTSTQEALTHLMQDEARRHGLGKLPSQAA